MSLCTSESSTLVIEDQVGKLNGQNGNIVDSSENGNEDNKDSIMASKNTGENQDSPGNINNVMINLNLNNGAADLVSQNKDTIRNHEGNGMELTDGKVIREDVFECVSKSREYYRLVLTTNQVILQETKNHSHIERYSISDLFGCHTLRQKNHGPGITSAYICFYLYPRSKKKSLMSNIKFREKLTLVFDVKKAENTYDQNFDIAWQWKQDTLNVLQSKYPKWQLYRTRKNKNNNGREEIMEISNLAIDSQDIMDHVLHEGESIYSVASYIPFLRRFLVVLNPKSGQGKTMEIFTAKVAPILKESGIKPDVQVTQHPGHARSIMASSDLSEIDGIITVGGDGILYEVVNGLRCRRDADRVANIPIGVVAGGSGNGLARSIADYSGESEDYLRNPVLSTTLCAARGKIMKVNLAEVDLDGRKVYSFLSVGWGLLSDIDVESEVLRALGESRFTIWAFYRLAKLRSYKARLSYIPWDKKCQDMVNGNIPKDENFRIPDPVVIDSDFVCVYSSCQSYIGSDLVFAPSATPGDGLIHLVYLLGSVGRARATQFLISIDKGTHLDVEGVKYVTVKEFTITNEEGIGGNLTIDGELVRGKKITVSLASKPLNMFAL